MTRTLHAFEFGVDGLWPCAAAVALPHHILGWLFTYSYPWTFQRHPSNILAIQFATDTIIHS